MAQLTQLLNTPTTMTKNKEKDSLQELMTKLEKTVEWFQSREDIDLEQGLERVKEAATLIKTLKGKLKEIENEFIEIKRDLDVDSD